MLADLQPTSFSADSLDLADLGDVRPEVPSTARAASESHVFTRLELLVIGIGTRDPLAKVESGRWARLRRGVFGIEVPRPFADPRLEALRMLAIALRRPGSPDAAIDAARAAGITRPQIEHLRSSRPRDLKG